MRRRCVGRCPGRLAGAASASELSDDLRARRARVMERLGPDTMLILWSAPAQRYSLDIDYEYRQDSNLYYLTGLTQEGTILVLMPGNVARREVLFVKDKDPAQEHWHGRTLTTDEARARTGIETVLASSQFEPFVAGMLGRQGHGAGHRAGRRAILRRAVGRPRPASRSSSTTGSAAAEPLPVAAAVREPDARAVHRLHDDQRHDRSSTICAR